MKGAWKPMEILRRINKMAGFGPDEEIELYEVGHPGFGYYVWMHLVSNSFYIYHISFISSMYRK